MKTTKRILAIITALVLCLAPMTLMVGAVDNGISTRAVHSRTCDFCGSTNVSYTEYASPRLVYQEGPCDEYCSLYRYEINATSCGNCTLTDHDYIDRYTYHNYITSPVNGSQICSNCNHIK